MNEFFTWSFLGTFAGAGIATAIITQFIKGYLAKVPTQIVSYAVSLIVLLAATAATGRAGDWSQWAIVPLNAVLVSLASNGAFVAIKRISGGE